MPEKYQDYLAANVLNQGNIISYRALSRGIKVHSNAAKQMLYEFHRTQNARKPSSVHATYLVCGTRKPHPTAQQNGGHHNDGEDALMSDSSIMMSSSMPGQEIEAEKIPVTAVTLVAEEQLEELKSLYGKILSIHIYSLEPGPLSNIHLLSDCNRKIAVDYASEDALETWKQYGTIHNPRAKRRTTRHPPPPPAAAAAVQPSAASTTPAAKAAQTAANATSTTKSASGKPPPQPKRETSDIFKSFAKSKNEPAKEQRSGAHSAAPGSLGPSRPEPPTAEDESMKDIPDMDSEADDEAEAEESEEALAQRNAEAAAAKEKADASRKARLERESNLRQMMEDDDDDDTAEKEAPEDEEASKDKDADGDDVMAEAETPNEDSDAPVDAAAKPPAADEAEQPPVTVSNGRRRGRRRVMKKKTTKDAEGYLVTKEEPVWESFSEEDRPAASAAASKPAVSAKGKKPAAGAKPGQGNIMSFFGRK